MKLFRREQPETRLELCERCALAENAAVIFAECARDRMIQNMLRSGFRPV
jgi:hypothetical protein